MRHWAHTHVILLVIYRSISMSNSKFCLKSRLCVFFAYSECSLFLNVATCFIISTISIRLLLYPKEMHQKICTLKEWWMFSWNRNVSLIFFAVSLFVHLISRISICQMVWRHQTRSRLISFGQINAKIDSTFFWQIFRQKKRTHSRVNAILQKPLKHAPRRQ